MTNTNQTGGAAPRGAAVPRPIIDQFRDWLRANPGSPPNPAHGYRKMAFVAEFEAAQAATLAAKKAAS